MNNINCPPTPYTPLQETRSRLDPYSRLVSPYTDQQFCLADLLLIEAGEFLTQENGSFIEL